MVGLSRDDGREWHRQGPTGPCGGVRASLAVAGPPPLGGASRGCPRGVDEAEEEEQHYEDLAALQHATVLDGHGGQFGVRAGHGGQFAECAGSRRNYRLLAGGIGADGARRWRRGFSLRLDTGGASRPSDRRDGTLLQLGGWPAHRHFAAPGALLAVVSGSRTRCEPSDPSPRPRAAPLRGPGGLGRASRPALADNDLLAVILNFRADRS